MNIINTIENLAIFYKNYFYNKDFLICFDNRFIEVRFQASNFKHLCGVDSSLRADKFFEKALKKTIKKSEINFSSRYPISIAKRKLNSFMGLIKLFKQDSLMLENLVTNTNAYNFGSTNFELSLLFINNESFKKYVPALL